MPKTFKQEDNEIAARAGETFIVELEGNPTTGYQWELSRSGEQFRMIEKDYGQPGAGIGAATKERFVIKALQPGSTALTFKYKRPWETEVLETKTFRLRIKPA